MVTQIQEIMSISRRVLGQSGEDMAALFFIQKGYEVVERNWRCRAGEIDLIIRKQNEWRFIEVKTRTSKVFGAPEEAVTPLKRRHFYAAIEWYVQQNKARISDLHADVVAIVLNSVEFEVKWLPDSL